MPKKQGLFRPMTTQVPALLKLIRHVFFGVNHTRISISKAELPKRDDVAIARFNVILDDIALFGALYLLLLFSLATHLESGQRLGGQRRALTKGASSESTFGARTIPFTFECCSGSLSIPSSGASFSSESPLPVALGGEVL